MHNRQPGCQISQQVENTKGPLIVYTSHCYQFRLGSISIVFQTETGILIPTIETNCLNFSANFCVWRRLTGIELDNPQKFQTYRNMTEEFYVYLASEQFAKEGRRRKKTLFFSKGFS